jgi:hypothetical protein
MASQAEKDTAAAKAKQGGGQAAKDTAAAKAKQNNNNQAAKDTARAKSRQNGGDGGTSARMSQREDAAGLSLAGNDTMSGRLGGISIPTMDQRESAAGLTWTSAGQEDSFYKYQPRPANPWQSADSEAFAPMSPMEFKDDEVTTEPESYAFKVIDDGDGSVSVLAGAVNTVTATGLEPAGKPTELWLKVTFDTDGVVTAASVEESSGTTSETEDYRQIASITWDGDLPTIVQGIKGSQSIASCGATHQWGTLYS